MASEEAKKISEALIRIAAYVRNSFLKHRLEGAAIDLLNAILLKNERQSILMIQVIRGFIGLGEQICEVEPGNAAFINFRLDYLDSAIRQSKFAGCGQIDINGIFGDINSADQTNSTASQKHNISCESADIEQKDELDDYNKSNSAIRQAKIAELIRQTEGSKAMMREIVAALGGVSERTVRYDLEKLIQSGVVKRVGDSGPNTHYVIK